MGPYAFHDYRYSVIDTDYENYALVYSCLNVDGKMEENAYILSRNKNLDVTTSGLLKRVLNRQYSIDASKFKQIEQSSC
jgi:hypothetical protein